jgi:hypothetical protein
MKRLLEPTPQRERRDFYLFALWIAIATAFIAVFFVSDVPQIDFPYCSGYVINHGEDPYLALPLARCEALLSIPTLPATTLPPYDLFVFRAFALLPYHLAEMLWRALLVGAVAVTVGALARCAKVHPALACAAVLPLALRTTLPSGQPYPLILAFLVCAALAIQSMRDAMAGALLTASMFEPNLGLPACIATFLFRPKARPALAIGAVFVAGLCFLGVWPNLTVRFLQLILPSQAASELHWVMQYSLTNVLATAGVPDRLAISAGSLDYCIMLLIGIALARISVERGSPAAVYVLLPPSAVALGGLYVHIWQFGVASAAALLIAESSVGRNRKIAVFAAVLLAIPWNEIGFDATAFVAIPSAFTIGTMIERRMLMPFMYALAVGVAHVVVRTNQPAISPPNGAMLSTNPLEIGQLPLKRYLAATLVSHPFVAQVAKIPTWCGELLLLFASFARRRSGNPERRSE